MNTYTFSIDVKAESEEEAIEKFQDENINPRDMDIEESELVAKGQKYTKSSNNLTFIVTAVIDDEVHFHEEHYFSPKVMNISTFLDIFTIKNEEL